MKAMMIWKELRENGKWAVLAAVVLSFLSLVSRTDDPQMDRFLTVSMYSWTYIFMPVMGIILGVLQIAPERRTDRWAFLIHRPAAPGTLFASKVHAGMLLYLVAVSSPVLFVTEYLAMPGHTAALWTPQVLLEAFVDMLNGIIFYFAAMLMVLRPARWYGSRGLPIIAALFCAFSSARTSFSSALLIDGIGILVLYYAARGSFIASGEYGGQTRLARFGLCVTLYAAIFAILFTIRGLLPVMSPQFQSQAVFTVNPSTMHNGTWFDLSSSEAYAQYRYPESIICDLDQLSEPREINWSYDAANRGRIHGFATRGARRIGSFGPDGFSTGGRGPGFDRIVCALDAFINIKYAHVLLASAGGSLYAVDLYARSVTPFAPGLAPNTIYMAAKATLGRETALFLAGRKTIFEVSPDGKLLASVSYPPGVDERSLIRVMLLSKDANFKIWYMGNSGWPNTIVEVDNHGSEVHTTPVPATRVQPGKYGRILDGTYNSSSPLIGSIVLAISSGRLTDKAIPLSVRRARIRAMATNLGDPRWIVSELLLSFLAYLIGLRCGWPPRGRLAWAFGIFWLGIPGLLMLLSLDRWPVRETCPTCGKKRVVTRETCERCGATWPATQRNGTEIFELEAAA